MNTKQAVQEGRTVLGIEFGSTRIKAVLVDENAHPIAQGGYDWENRYVDNIWFPSGPGETTSQDRLLTSFPSFSTSRFLRDGASPIFTRRSSTEKSM